MKILGINAGMGASVCLLDDGHLIFAMEEERPTRLKAKGGFPSASLAYLRERYPDFLAHLDRVAIADLSDLAIEREELQRRYDRRFRGEQDDRPLLRRTAAALVPETVKRWVRPRAVEPGLIARVQSELNQWQVPREKFVRLQHHVCHASAAYFGLAKDADTPYLVLTLDGGGDAECASVSIGQHGRLTKVAGTPSGNSIGNIYSNITYLLGLKPHEHEYKIMGLDPYVPEKYRPKVAEILRTYLRVDRDSGLTFERLIRENTNWIGRRLAEDLKFIRFDSIAAGLQMFTEDLILEWVRNAIRHTGVRDVLLSGGVFMNVKANKLISELPDVRTVNCFPSCGDETNSIGIAFHTFAEMTGGKLPQFTNFTLGPTPTFDLKEATQRFANACEFKHLESPNRTIAEIIAGGNIVARCSGQMEVGARALGNRSLLADPRDPNVVERLNFLIKQRDFWMPFAPAILAEEADRYLDVPDTLPGLISPYMMFAFDTKETRGDLPAALHRADRTARAQIVHKHLYPDLHEIISHFKDRTGRGALLNTSFNRHGEPIVMGSVDAIEVLLDTDLEYLVVEDTLITKR